MPGLGRVTSVPRSAVLLWVLDGIVTNLGSPPWKLMERQWFVKPCEASKLISIKLHSFLEALSCLPNISDNFCAHQRGWVTAEWSGFLLTLTWGEATGSKVSDVHWQGSKDNLKRENRVLLRDYVFKQTNMEQYVNVLFETVLTLIHFVLCQFTVGFCFWLWTSAAWCEMQMSNSPSCGVLFAAGELWQITVEEWLPTEIGNLWGREKIAAACLGLSIVLGERRRLSHSGFCTFGCWDSPGG